MMLAMLAMIAVLDEPLQLRGGEAAPPGTVIAVDAAGVHMGPSVSDGKAVGEALVIPWDRVRTVGSGDAAQFRDVADEAWRARTRLERGDFISAEPLFEKLFEQYRGQKGATSAVVAEGLLRCRLRRGAHILAIDPWLTLLQATGGQRTPFLHENWSSEAAMAPVVDSTTGLVPGLPPMWLSWQAVDSYAKGTMAAEGSSRGEVLAQIYYQAARFESGLGARLPELATNDAGVNVCWQIVQSRIGGAEQREAARKFLYDRLGPHPAAGVAPVWLEAWCRAAIGRSLIREDSTEQKEVGVIELLNVPARFSRSHPYLAGLALAEASATLRSIGDAEGADTLLRELQVNFPSHPVLDWPAIRGLQPKAPRPPAAKEGAIPDSPAAPAPPPSEPPK
jgi:hypothetical protein